MRHCQSQGYQQEKELGGAAQSSRSCLQPKAESEKGLSLLSAHQFPANASPWLNIIVLQLAKWPQVHSLQSLALGIQNREGKKRGVGFRVERQMLS